VESKTYKQTNAPGQTIQSASPGCFWLALILAFACGFPALAQTPRFVPGRILIKPKAHLSETNLTRKLNERGAVRREKLPHLDVRVVSVPEQNTEALIAALRDDPDIEFVERDFLAEAAYVPNDAYVGNEWHLGRIQAHQAWDLTTGRSNVVVAVLDSGVNPAHPDLTLRLLAGYDFVSDTAAMTDDLGHGTAVAGTIVAHGNNGLGLAGVAYSCRVMPVKVMDAGGFAAYSTVAQGIRYAVDNGARIINLSLAGSSPSSTLQDAINYAWSRNVLVIAAAGNNANSTLQYPAACNHVVAVSSTGPGDSLSAFSSYGYVALAAPGENIWTTQRTLNNLYGAWSGTSFACPIVASAAALVASINPTLSSDGIATILKQSADDLGTPGFDPSFGHGRLNALKAVTAASQAPGGLPGGPPPPPEPGTTNPPPADITPPSVILAQSPKDGSRAPEPQLTLAGTAADNVGVREVQVSVNGSVELADGTTNWSAGINLAAGTNFIRIRSVDFAGNASPEVTLTVSCVINTPLVVRTEGLGTVTPKLNGSLLEIGKTYTLKAVPGPGQVFAGWDGLPTPSPAIRFVMASNLAFTARFVPSPFPLVKGSYAGLAANLEGVTPDTSGYFTLTVTASGAFTGKVLLGGARYGFRGQYNLAGDALVTVPRGSTFSPLQLSLHIDLTGETDTISGSLTDGAWVAEVSADRNVFNSKYNPAAQAGLRNFILQRMNTTIEAATGAGKISTAGKTSVRGRLEDDRAFSTASALARNGDCPFYLSLSKGTEIVIGWLNFPTTPDPTASGTVLWVRTGTNAFAATLQAASAP